MTQSQKIEVRPELLRFAEAMERVLRKNDWKGETTYGCDPTTALDGIWDEVRELDRESYGHPNISTSRAKFGRMKKEAVDVANFAMLFWLGCGESPEDPEE